MSTLRDELAAAALGCFRLPVPGPGRWAFEDEEARGALLRTARAAYAVADAMLKARDAPPAEVDPDEPAKMSAAVLERIREDWPGPARGSRDFGDLCDPAQGYVEDWPRHRACVLARIVERGKGPRSLLELVEGPRGRDPMAPKG